MPYVDPFAAPKRTYVDPFAEPKRDYVDPFAEQPAPEVVEMETSMVDGIQIEVPADYVPANVTVGNLADLGIQTPEEMAAEDAAREPIKEMLAKPFVRGIERAEASVGNIIEAAGDAMQQPGAFIEKVVPMAAPLRKFSEFLTAQEIPQPESPEWLKEKGRRVEAFGREVSDFWNEMANTGWEAPDPKIFEGGFLENPSAERIVAGAVESLPLMGVALGLSYGGAPNAGAALLAGSEAAPVYREAKDAGVAEGDAFAYAVITGLGTAALERVGLDALTGKSPAVDALIKKMGRNWVAGAIVNFGVEGSQEALQQMWQNAVAMGYDGDRSVFDNALEAGLSGGLLGGGVGSAQTIYSNYMQQQATRAKDGLTEQQVDEVVREAMKPAAPPVDIVDQETGQPYRDPNIQEGTADSAPEDATGEKKIADKYENGKLKYTRGQIQELLRPLLDRGLMIREGSHYLSLAIPVGKYIPSRKTFDRFLRHLNLVKGLSLQKALMQKLRISELPHGVSVSKEEMENTLNSGIKECWNIG